MKGELSQHRAIFTKDLKQGHLLFNFNVGKLSFDENETCISYLCMHMHSSVSDGSRKVAVVVGSADGSLKRANCCFLFFQANYAPALINWLVAGEI